MIDCIYRWERTSYERDDEDSPYRENWSEVYYASEYWIDNKLDEADRCWNAFIEENCLDYVIDYYFDATENNWTHEEMDYISIRPAIENAGERELEALDEADYCEQRTFHYEESSEGLLVTIGEETQAVLNIDTMEWVG